MAGLEEIQTTIMQLAIQAATVAVMALNEADMGPASDMNTANVGEVHRPRHDII